MLLTATLIVKNEAANLRRCLQSIDGVVDEVVVVDTGSTDDTIAIAKSLGARVIEHAWTNDFAVARNVGLAAAQGEWILHLDADEEVPPETARALRDAVSACPVDGLLVTMHHFTPNDVLTDHLESDEVRVFRNRPEHRFELNLHTQILPSIQRAGGTVAPSGLRIWHYGYLSEQAQGASRQQRNLELLRAEAERRPDDAYSWIKLGLTQQVLGLDDEAQRTLLHVWRDLSVDGVNVDVLQQSLAALAAIADRRADFPEARHFARLGLELPQNGRVSPTLHLISANAALQIGVQRTVEVLTSAHKGQVTLASQRVRLPSARGALAEAVEGFKALTDNSALRPEHRANLLDRLQVARAQLGLCDRLMARASGLALSSDCPATARRGVSVQLKRPATLGAVRGLPWGGLWPFFESWTQHVGRRNPDARLVIFGADLDVDTETEIRRHATLIPFNPGAQSVNVERYRLYADWLSTHPDVDGALLTDVRDVVFQGDPFADPLEAELVLPLEDPLFTLGCETNNAEWLRTLYGRERWAELSALPIACSGTVLGTSAAISRYLDSLSRELVAHSTDGRLAGLDQGAHNALLHSGRLPGAIAVPNGGRILTAGSMFPEDLTADDGGRVLAADGHAPAIVHQYDRHPHLIDAVVRALTCLVSPSA